MGVQTDSDGRLPSPKTRHSGLDEIRPRIERHLEIRKNLRETAQVMGLDSYSEALEWFRDEPNYHEYEKVARLIDDSKTEIKVPSLRKSVPRVP